MRRLWAAWVLTVATLSPSVFANGRYVRAQQLLVDPTDENRLWLRATYGVVTSGDHGKTWKWICESALGISDGEDPAMAVTADGTVLVGGSTGLFSTSDHGCSFRPHPDISEYVIDLATYGGGTHVLALTNVIEQSGASDLFVWRSDDAGHGFVKLGPAISKDLFGMTLDAAPSDPNRIYVTGVPATTAGVVDPTTPGTLLRSRDGAVTWERVPIAGTNAENWPMIAAVNPGNADAVYVRVRGASNPPANVESWLLVSSDAGSTFGEVFRGQAEMFGFALPNAASTLLIGMGSSYDPNQRPVDRSALGVYRADPSGSSWTRGIRGQVGCLTNDASGLYVCSTHESLGFELGLSEDLGATATKIMDFGPEIALPSCEVDGSSAARCADLWTVVCHSLGACGPTLEARPSAAFAARGGCGCRLGHGETPDAFGLMVPFAVFASARRRLQRRAQGSRSRALVAREP